MELKTKFDEATEVATKLAYRPSNERLLQLFSFQQQATQGNVDTNEPDPSDLTERAKHDAWADLKGMDQTEAMSKYIELVEYLSQKSEQSVLV